MRLACVIALIFTFGGIAAAQQPETNFPVGPQYLITQPYPTILQPIATPSYEPSEPSGVVSPQTGEAGPVTITIPAYLPSVYWGYTPPGAVEVPTQPVQAASAPASNNLPSGYVDVGVSTFATPNWLNGHDYGMSVAQAAQYWKAKRLHAARVYTNKDIERMNGE